MIPEDLKEEAKNYGAAITKKKAKNQQIPVFFPRELMSKKWNIRRERERERDEQSCDVVQKCK